MTQNLASLIGNISALRSVLEHHAAWFTAHNIDVPAQRKKLDDAYAQLLQSINATTTAIHLAQDVSSQVNKELSANPQSPASALLQLLQRWDPVGELPTLPTTSSPRF